MPKRKKKKKGLLAVCLHTLHRWGWKCGLVISSSAQIWFLPGFSVTPGLPDCIGGLYPSIKDNSLVNSGLYLRRQDLYPGLRLYLSGPLYRTGEKLDEAGAKELSSVWPTQSIGRPQVNLDPGLI